MKKLSTRALACHILFKVIHGALPFHPRLVQQAYPDLQGRDLAFISYLCFGVLRFYHRLLGYLAHLRQTPLKKSDQDIQLLILIGLYQLLETQTPEHAILNETVNACVALKKPHTKALVNGILRQAQRQKLSLLALKEEVIQTAHPTWLTAALKAAWPKDWENIIKAHLIPPPMTLRVNTQKLSRADYLDSLKSIPLPATICPFASEALILKDPIAVEKLPGFESGWISIQDSAAQLAAHLLDLKPHLRVLDACAAPGGKTAHILEMQPDLKDVWAIEQDSSRLLLLNQTLARLQLKAQVIAGDATQVHQWWDGVLFDRILLDAPCSATGVIRRHPDIKVHRQRADLTSLVKQQRDLFAALWPLLKSGGILLYVTCSILPEENEQQMAHFTKRFPNAKILPIEATWGRAQEYGRQILSGEENMDGFYYARLIKQR